MTPKQRYIEESVTNPPKEQGTYMVRGKIGRWNYTEYYPKENDWSGYTHFTHWLRPMTEEEIAEEYDNYVEWYSITMNDEDGREFLTFTNSLGHYKAFSDWKEKHKEASGK